jgi:hypothetical protein
MAASNDGQGRGKKKKTNKENLIGKIPKENGGKTFFIFSLSSFFPSAGSRSHHIWRSASRLRVE